MNSVACPFCGCGNMRGVAECVRCGGDLMGRNAPREADFSTPKTTSPVFSVILGILLLAIGAFVVTKYLSIDNKTKLSTFDKYHKGVSFPSEAVMRKGIEGQETKKTTVAVSNTNYVPCANFDCIETRKVTEDREVIYHPNVKEFEITAGEIAADSDGNITYRASYHAVLQGGRYCGSSMFDRVQKEDKVERTVDGKFTIFWKAKEKQWEADKLPLNFGC